MQFYRVHDDVSQQIPRINIHLTSLVRTSNSRIKYRNWPA
jgi:hypothetical protein